METQWPLVLFTFFVCLSCGIFGGISLLAIRGKGEKLQFSATIASLVTLAVGGICVFFHLQHWDRIFNGFGHITSGITHELIGCVVLGVLMVIWLVMGIKKKPVTKALAWITLICAAAMVAVTGHSYMMPARPGWGIDLVIYYLCDACIMGAVSIWALGAFKKDDDAVKTGIEYSFWGSIIQLAGMAIYVLCTAFAKVTNYSYYADPTQMTTTPTHVDSLLSTMLVGDGAAMFWISVVCAVVTLICAYLARKKEADKATTFMAVAAAGVIVAGLTFRVVFYVVGYSLFTLY